MRGLKTQLVKYGNVEYPMYAHFIGLAMSLMSMLWIPGYAIYYILNQRGSLKDVSIIFDCELTKCAVLRLS